VKRLLLNPFGQAATMYLVALAMMFAYLKGVLLPVFGALSVYSVGTAVANALRARWWLHTAMSLVAWLLLFVLLSGTGDAIRGKPIGEDAMVLLMPMMVFPLLLVASGIYRLTRGPTLKD
jgi:ABC-type methionine transport system permease subunit